MLVLSRKVDQSIVINNNIRVTIVEIRGNRIRLGFEAPADVKILRSELTQASRPHSTIKPTSTQEQRSIKRSIECYTGD